MFLKISGVGESGAAPSATPGTSGTQSTSTTTSPVFLPPFPCMPFCEY